MTNERFKLETIAENNNNNDWTQWDKPIELAHIYECRPRDEVVPASIVVRHTFFYCFDHACDRIVSILHSAKFIFVALDRCNSHNVRPYLASGSHLERHIKYSG